MIAADGCDDDLPVLPCNLCRRVPRQDCRVRLSSLNRLDGGRAYASICDDCLSRPVADVVGLLALGGEEYAWAQPELPPAEAEDEHVVPGELNAAYARAVDDRFDGFAHPEGHDGVATLIDAWASPESRTVIVTIAGTNIRVDLTPKSADSLGRILIAEATRSGGP